MRRILAFSAVALGLLLAGCAQNITSDVARFHQMSGQTTGQTFRIVPFDASQENSLEFQQYAALVRGELAALGYSAVNAAVAADLDVQIDYGVSPGREKLIVRQGAGYPFGYFPYRYYNYWGFYDPFFYGSGFRDELDTQTVYTRSLMMKIERRAAEGEQPGQRLFEGRVNSVGTQNGLPEVMPYLVQAMFTAFPGESGKTTRVTIELPKK